MWQQPIAVPGGHCQSPIDIVVRKSVFDSALKPLATDYDPETCQQIWNNGYSFLVEYDDSADKSSECVCVWGGQSKYLLWFIWLPKCSCSSLLLFLKGGKIP